MTYTTDGRDLHPVSCKVAIYSPDRASVLTVNLYKPNSTATDHGLPGGHIDKNEEPLVALKRELLEELAIDDIYDIELKDAWFHPSGKLVLGYVAKRDTTELPQPPNPDVEFGEWVSLDKVEGIMNNTYAKFIQKYSKIK